MPEAARIGDLAQSGAETDDVAAEASSGSPDVFVDGRALLRADDGGSGFTVSGGSSGVFVNGRPAARAGDATAHGASAGAIFDGSADVLIGDMGRGTPRDRPHEGSALLTFVDALDRLIEDVEVEVFCPHAATDKQVAHGTLALSGLCTGSSVTVKKALQAGQWDEEVAQSPLRSQHVIAPPAGPDVPDANASSQVIHTPAPAATPPDKQTTHVTRPNGGTTVRMTTVHNWVELVYRAFGHHLPTEQLHLALLGMREASIKGKKPIAELEKEAGWGDIGPVDYTRERFAPRYNDLLFCAYTDRTLHTRQNVEVFECTIDASPHKKGHLHLPWISEGHILHAKPGPFHTKHYPGHDISLHLFKGAHEHYAPKGATADDVLRVAHKEIGTTEHPPYSNYQKYGAWYGDNGAFWCAQFVSWVFTHAGMPEIHYEGCRDGAGHFQNGAWGSYHSGQSHAEPGDIVFYDFPGEGPYAHTGIVVKDHGSYITTIEGNTSPDSSGSQFNGGGVFLKSRSKNSEVMGFGRPRFKQHTDEPFPVIRWGGERAKVEHKYAKDCTLLHHHYFKADHHGHQHVDQHAERYRRFRHVYREARNAHRIPYLVVSSKYVKTYAEWVKWLDAHPGVVPSPRSVIRTEHLVSPPSMKHKYLPSYLSAGFAERLVHHIGHMHDRHAAHQLRLELEAALFELHV